MLDNCRECGKLFNRINSFYCPKCEVMIDGYYQCIRDYIWDNGQATVLEIHEATGVAEKWIRKLRDDGRLIDCNSTVK